MFKHLRFWIYVIWLTFLYIYAHAESDRFSTFLFFGFAIAGFAEAILFLYVRIFSKVDWSVDFDCIPVGSLVNFSFKTRLAPWVPGIVHLSLRLPWSEQGGFSCNLHNSMIRHNNELTFKHSPNQRGYYVIGPCLLTLEDPLGLFRNQYLQGSTKEIYITPRLLDIRHLFSNFSEYGEQGKHLYYSGGPSGGARKYQLGDPINRIHWKATARMQTMMVREYETDNQTETCLWLNLYREDYRGDSDSLETAISLAATLLTTYSSNGIPLTFWTTGSKFTKFCLEGPSDIEESLRYLATARANGSFTMAQALGSLPECSSLMIITGNVRPDFTGKLNSLLRNSQKPLLMITGNAQKASENIATVPQGLEVFYWHESRTLQGEV